VPTAALRFTLAQASRIATQAHAPYVGTEHLVAAMLWEDHGGGLRRQGVGYAQAAEQLATLLLTATLILLLTPRRPATRPARPIAPAAARPAGGEPDRRARP
jgi:hypothetical protein